MKKIFIVLLSLTLTIGISACSPNDSLPTPEIPEQPNVDNPDTEPTDSDNMIIKIGSSTFTATFINNATAKAFKALLPMTINMNELNGNEKYYDLPNTLPTEPSSPGTIRNGDIMLYGSKTLVLFYKTFSSSYSYTYIGRVDNPSELGVALGSGNISITFEQIKK